MGAVFETASGEQLHAEADAEHGLLHLKRQPVQQGLQALPGVNGLHGVAERPHARQHQPVGGLERVEVGGHDRILADILKGVHQ